MKDKLLIIGASGHGKVVADIAIKMNKWNTIAFLDDNESLKSSFGLQVLGQSNEVRSYVNDYDIFVAIGNNKIREKISNDIDSLNIRMPILIHPNAVISEDVKIDSGSVIMAGVVINASTKIGKGCIINTSSSLDHDNMIGDYVHVSPGAHLAGNVTVGNETWIGIGTSVSNNLSIVEECKIGAGAVVVNSILEHGTYVGIPAKKNV
ncbi:putative acetyltransferase [Bacillus sp. TS-2]|nr:putative acetyltransferase [Bacillus sp. TS-2]